MRSQSAKPWMPSGRAKKFFTVAIRAASVAERAPLSRAAMFQV
jgi:hypothetical protein